MNYRIYTLIVASLTCMASETSFVPKTTYVAAQEGYPQFIIALRDKAIDFLVMERIRMGLDVQALRKQHLDYRATKLSEQDFAQYLKLEDDIDMVFDQISHEFLQEGEQLDLQGASYKEKAQFVANTKKLAQERVTEKLRSYGMIFKNNLQSIDNQ